MKRLLAVSNTGKMDNEKEKNGLGEYLFHSLMPLKEAVMEVERQLIEESPEKVRQHLEALGVNQSTVVRRMARFRKHE